MDLVTTLCPNNHGKVHPTEAYILGKIILKNSEAKKWKLSLFLITYAMFYLLFMFLIF